MRTLWCEEARARVRVRGCAHIRARGSAHVVVRVREEAHGSSSGSITLFIHADPVNRS